MFLGRVLLDSPHYSLVAGLFGSLSVTSKAYERTVKALPVERSYFLDLCTELERLGVAITPSNGTFTYACEGFCEAVLSRPGAAWKAYFRPSPAETARDVVGAF